MPYDIIEQIKELPEYHQNIQREHDAHPLLHHDEFDLEDNHYHFKMKGYIKPEILSKILKYFLDKDLITSAEKQFVEKKYDEFLQLEVTILLSALTGDNVSKETSKEKILGFIQACQCNSKLVTLHAHLMRDEFSYLRTHGQSRWRTVTGNNATIVKTSATWATIEHWITLALYRNLMILCPKFPPSLAREYAAQINREFPFTSLDRSVIFYAAPSNQEFSLFQQANKAKLREIAESTTLTFDIPVTKAMTKRLTDHHPDQWTQDNRVKDHERRFKLFHTRIEAEMELKHMGELFPEQYQHIKLREQPSKKDPNKLCFFLIYNKPPASQLQGYFRK